MLSHGRSTDSIRVFSDCFSESMEVAFTCYDKSYSYGFATRTSLQNALRTDIEELLKPEFKERANNVEELFCYIIYNPRLMFDFSKFKSLFAREVIPSQILLHRAPILFNPTQLEIFGCP